ncbi:MAG: oligopeptide:H+ symporter [Phycisphaeraceae bacterium]|nr:oligopeptide:H+ symporter [Phycisphaeraceae bacterium]
MSERPPEGQGPFEPKSAPLPGDMQHIRPTMETLKGGPGAPIKERQPAGLFLLFVVEMWERFSYYGMRALLVLFMTSQVMKGEDGVLGEGLGWSRENAGVLVAWYTSMVYLTGIFGGYLADKLIGTHRSMLTGGTIIAIGHIVLSGMGFTEPGSPATVAIFITGLALIVIGTGFFKPCVSVMVGQLYRQGDSRRDAGFTIFYMGINVGALLGALACGYLGEKVGWHWGFGAAAVGMIAGMVVYVIWRPRLLSGIGLPPAKHERPPASKTLTRLALMIGATALLIGIAQMLSSPGKFVFGVKLPMFPDWAAPAYGITIVVGAILGIILFILSQKPGEKGPVAAIFIISTFVICFWLAFEQAATSLNLFALHRTDRVLPGMENQFPASWYQSVNSAFILIFAPVLAILWAWMGRRRIEPSTPVKMGLGLILLGLGFVVMVFVAQKTDGGRFLAEGANLIRKVGPYWLILVYFLHTIGELFLSPIGLSLVTKLAPVKWMSLLMGVWFLSPAIAQFIGGMTFSKIEKIEKGELFNPIIGGQADFYLIFVITSLGAGVIMLGISPVLKKLMHGRA